MDLFDIVNNSHNIDDTEYIDNENCINISKCQCHNLKLLQAIAYNFIKKFTNNEHLRFIFTSYAMTLQYRNLTCDELLKIFKYKHLLQNVNF
jgi:hypothetical protein